MHYIFVINSRPDKEFIAKDVQAQIDSLGVDLDYEVYHTTGIGDGTRFVRIYCDLHPTAKVCFVACGGSGTFNEVVSGVVGFHEKYVIFLAYGSSNDFTKYYPERDFTDLRKAISGDVEVVDIIKVNDSYSINVINVGLSAEVASAANYYIELGQTKNAYTRGIARSMIFNRFNRIKVFADGEQINKSMLQECAIGNCRVCGGEFNCAPYAVNDDGLMDVVLMNVSTLTFFLLSMQHYRKGTYLEKPFFRRKFVFRRASHVDIKAKTLISVCLDGEVLTGQTFSIDVLPKEIHLFLPKI